MYVEIDTTSYEPFAREWLIGRYAKLPPAIDARYVSLWQAVRVSGEPANIIGMAVLRNQIEAVRNPVGHWVLNAESFREWCASRELGQARYLWLAPPGDREISLVNELITRSKQLYDEAQAHWMSTGELIDRLMSAIHQREQLRREGGDA